MVVGRFAVLAGVVGLQLVMRSPVWHLFTRFNLVGGSTGWHRYYLIDEAIKHFDEWALLGTPSTAHWGRGLLDVTNQYVGEAVRGGLAGLLLFLFLVVLGFRAVGRIWRSAWPDRASVALAWSLGVSLLTQCVSFFSVAYFDQSSIIWFIVLACLASMSTAPRTEAKRADRTPSKPRELCEQPPLVAQGAGMPRWFGS
jgi:O-antigen ligase